MLIRPCYLLLIPSLAFPLFSFPCAGLIETVAFFVFFDSVQMLKQLCYFGKKCWCDVFEFPFSCLFWYLYQRFMSGHLSCLLCATIGFHIFPLTFLYWVLSSLFNWASGCRLPFCLATVCFHFSMKRESFCIKVKSDPMEKVSEKSKHCVWPVLVIYKNWFLWLHGERQWLHLSARTSPNPWLELCPVYEL